MYCVFHNELALDMEIDHDSHQHVQKLYIS